MNHKQANKSWRWNQIRPAVKFLLLGAVSFLVGVKWEGELKTGKKYTNLADKAGDCFMSIGSLNSSASFSNAPAIELGEDTINHDAAAATATTSVNESRVTQLSFSSPTSTAPTTYTATTALNTSARFVPREQQQQQHQVVVKYSLNPHRMIRLRPLGNPGYGNQLQCWNLAATFAVHWNRTLWLPYHAMSTTFLHNVNPYSMQELYDFSKIPIPFGLPLQQNQEYPSSCWQEGTTPSFEVDPYHQIHAEEEAASREGPFPNATCIILDCGFADPLVTSAPGVFPESINNNWWPYHPSMHDLADSIVERLRNGTKGRILGMQVRRGDRKRSSPFLNCSHFNGMSLQRREKSILCVGEEHNLTWSWEFLLPRMSEILNLSEFNAVFFASDEPEWVKSVWNHSSLPLYSLADFFEMAPARKARTNDVQDLVRELLVLSRVDYLIPSIRSSITDILLRAKFFRNGHRNEDKRWLFYHNEATRLYKNFTDDVFLTSYL